MSTPIQQNASQHEFLDDLPETIVSSSRKAQLFQIVRDWLEYRELFWVLVVRDIKVRYKQTALGVVWVILQPLLASGVFALVFRQVGAMKDVSAAESLLFFLAGLVPWNTFSNAVNASSSSMERMANMIRKIYFPRTIVPTSAVCGTVVDYLVAFVVMLLVAAALGKVSLLLIIMAPVLLTMQLMLAFALGFIFGSLNAQYRDVKYVIPFLLNLGLFLTVLVPLDSWGPTIGTLLSFNPMSAVIETYRSILAGTPLNGLLIGKGFAVSLGLLTFGLWFFWTRERKILDIL